MARRGRVAGGSSRRQATVPRAGCCPGRHRRRRVPSASARVRRFESIGRQGGVVAVRQVVPMRSRTPVPAVAFVGALLFFAVAASPIISLVSPVHAQSGAPGFDSSADYTRSIDENKGPIRYLRRRNPKPGRPCPHRRAGDSHRRRSHLHPGQRWGLRLRNRLLHRPAHGGKPLKTTKNTRATPSQSSQPTTPAPPASP